ncbi:MAG: hypothetical protein K0Q57_694, partial [Gammaproteobacteria bacterium]|nr:hypothetical protein [Gammaproteobacteria bacterium]
AEKAEYKAIKDRMEAILEQLAKTEQPGFKHYEMFREALASIKKVQAVSYQDKQWQIVQALLVVLPVAVARLKELFAERATVDFNEISLAALQALGAEEEPTELALSLDYQIRHLLIDEFQDTSQLQFQLLKALTRGWEPYDGRSLFLVGDPMQSIYRFRQADVSLFIQAKNYGIGNLALEYVQLTANFRSDQAVIDWVNHHFADIFPLQDDMVKGAVSYRPSIATRQYTDSEVKFMLTETALEEASLICEKVQALLCQAPEDNIAILVRSRSHLQAILPVLQAAGINYQAVEIESITERQVIRDLLSLTYALCHLGDKLSWLAILRAPWCGLGLSDLSLIAQASKSCPVWQALQSHELLQTLSGPGQASLARIIPILAASIMQRDRLSPRQFLEITWWNLDGPRCLTEKIDLENAESFFTMIEALSDKGRLPEREVIEQHLRGLKAQVQVLSTAPVQIMTIHKAKGLEFDSVILPGIGKGERSDTAALLLWESYALPDGSHGLLMAPIKSRNEADEPIYNFIDDANKGRKQFESQRLLYVAVTRAKKRLYLFGQCYFSEKQQAPVPRSGSFLALLWPKVQTQQFAQSLNQTGSVMPKIMPASHLKLARLDPASSSLFKVFDTNIEPASLPKLFDQGSFVQKAIGTLVHRYLAEIANFGLDNWPISKLESLLGKLAQELSLMGVPESECTKAAEQVQTALIKILQDDTGRWILSEHQQAHSELALVHFDAGRCKKYIIDRTFVDQNNERWIIDYKTSEPKTGQDLQEFLQQQKAQYREQLESYAKILSDKKIQHLGLYFPLMSYLYKIE